MIAPLCTPMPRIYCWFRVCFFFQAEDGIRDLTVTGVQTCALPISARDLRPPGREAARDVQPHPRLRAGGLPVPGLRGDDPEGDLARDPQGRGRRLRRRSEEHTSELQSQSNLVCRLLLEKKKSTRP